MTIINCKGCVYEDKNCKCQEVCEKYGLRIEKLKELKIRGGTKCKM